jgi:hypothetical protein
MITEALLNGNYELADISLKADQILLVQKLRELLVHKIEEMSDFNLDETNFDAQVIKDCIEVILQHKSHSSALKAVSHVGEKITLELA